MGNRRLGHCRLHNMRFVILPAIPAFIRYLEVTPADKLWRNKLNLSINKLPAYRRQLISTDVTDFLVRIQVNVYVLNAVFRKGFQQVLNRC